jgi:predicted MFS family arabinose efflux permease
MGDRLFTTAFIALAAADLVYFTASGLLIGVTPFLVTGPLGSDKAGLGLALGAFSLTTVIVRPLVGRMVDRLGRRRLMLLGVTLFAMMLAAHLLITQLWMLVAVRLIMGIAESLYFVAGFAALADLAPAGRTGEALSFASVALFLGIALGPGIGELLLDWRGFAAAWVGGTVLALLAVAMILFVPETGEPAPEDAKPPPLVHRAAVWPGLALFTGVAGSSGFLALVGLHATEIGFPRWSVTPLVYGGTVVICRIAFAKVPDRLPPLKLAAGSLGLCTIGLAVIGARPTVAGMLSGTVVLAVGVAFLTPAIFAAVFGSVPAHERGVAAGTTTIFIDLGLGGGPLLLGLVAAQGGSPLSFVFAATLTTAGAAVLLPAILRQRHRGRST